ncbi:MAG: hypothetical protein JO069_05830 [Verrucomicrobia bacterium]|nr:hypothetical protein [Verrucomicrobiota bacterium]
MNPSVYPRWERNGPVSRFLLGPDLFVYQIEEVELIGGTIFIASGLDTADLVGQFESEDHAKQACARNFAERLKAGEAHQAARER